MKISRRAALAAASLALLGRAYALSAQDQQDIARVEQYLNGIKTLKAKFLQISPTGASATGRACLDRSGRMRFEYDKPSPLLLVAGNGLVIFHDSSLDQTTNIPLSKTPLGILLQDNIALSGDVTVTRVVRDPGALALVMQRTSAPGEGTITLLFQDDPLELKGWIIHDTQGQDTRISLDQLDFSPSGFSPDLFTYTNPKLLEGTTP